MALVFHQTNHSDGGRWENRLCLVAHNRLVVEGHVSARNRSFELLARAAHAFDGAHKLPVHFRIVGVAKIQAVGDGAGHPAGAHNVPCVFRNRNHGAYFGVCVHVAAVAVHGHGQRPVGSFNFDDGGVGRTVGAHVHRAHHGVVLFVHPALAGYVGQCNDLLRNGVQVLRDRNVLNVKFLIGFVVGRLAEFAVVHRGATAQHQRLRRQIAHQVSVPEITHGRAFSNHPNFCAVDVPLGKNGFHFRLAAFFHHHQHALLALGKQDFPGGHAVLARGNTVQMDVHAYPTAGTHFRRRTRNARSAHVLHARYRSRLGQFQRGFQQELFLERVAYLNRRNVVGGVFG